MTTAADRYLYRIQPARTNSRGQPNHVPESRRRNWEAVRQAVDELDPDPEASLSRVVAAVTAAADRHGADLATVWKHVRRWRALNCEAEQLALPY